MVSFRLISKQAGLLAAVFAVVASAFVPALASADVVSNRSVQLSSSGKSASAVDYTFNFTTGSGTSGAAVVYFCSNSPLVGAACTAPTGFTSAAATATGATVSGTPTVNQVVVTNSFTSSAANTFTLGSITNPSSTDALYARVVTFVDATAAAAYISDPTTLGTPVDQGSFAISITNDVSVTGSVLETLTFCVSKAPITDRCVTTTPPTLELGQTTGTVTALDAGTLSTGDLYTQISTNAAHGAVVNLKSSTSCGGLKRADAATCDIAPALKGGTVAAGDAKFGVEVASATDLAVNSGIFQPAATSTYNASTYELNYVAGGASGVTSTYGDPFLDTSSAPANGKNMKLTFGASISNDTPAGTYATSLSLIATGTF